MDANKCIEELLKQLEEERRNVRREKLAVACLQREIERSKSEGTMREKLIHQLEEERRLRLDSERRLREVTEESELGRTQMTSLQQHFSRMEDTVRTLLQNQGVLDSTAMDTVDIMKVYKDKLSKEMEKQEASEEKRVCQAAEEQPAKSGQSEAEKDAAGDEAGDEAKDETRTLLDRLKALEEENSALAIENENQRGQYERCLDEVANQVVQALLTQKDLREECLKLRTRVFDLEQQNRTLSVLFQQKLRPASDLLLQKLYSRLMDLSSGDLLMDQDRTKHLLLTRNTDSPPHELTGKGFPVGKCSSQLSLTASVCAHAYGRSSCSSSELSLSSACSEFSSGSYTWNDSRSCAKLSSLTWEKRSGLGSSVPSNICAPLEDQFPARPKECHILEGLRRLQRRRPKESSLSASSRRPKSAFKDCMNSNEGIYSLGMKAGGLGASKSAPSPPCTSALVREARKFVYDSDDADDESAHVASARQRHSVPSKDGVWLCSKKLSHSVSDSLCSWDGIQDSVGGGNGTQEVPSEPPPPYSSQERPERLLSFINGFLFSGKRCSAPTPTTQMQYELSSTETDGLLHLSESDDPDDNARVKALSEQTLVARLTAEVPEKDPKRFSRDSDQMHRLRREQVRAQSADSRPRPLSLVKDQKSSKAVQSEESISTIFDADGQPIKLCEMQVRRGAPLPNVAPSNETPTKMGPPDYAELVAQERPSRLRGGGHNNRNYSVLESPEKPGETHLRVQMTGRTSSSREGSTERLQSQPGTHQHKLIKPPYNRTNKGHSVPPMTNVASPAKASNTKIPATRGKSSPLKVSLGPGTEPSGTPGSMSQEKSPSSPPVKLSRFLKAPSSGQSPKTAPLSGSKLPARGEWGRSLSSSPHLSRRHLAHTTDYGEQPTRDRHFEKAKSELRSPSPPPPPGRTTSLLIRPNYEALPQALKAGGPPPPTTPNTVRGPPPSYQPPSNPNMQHSCPQKDVDTLEVDAGYGTVNPQKLAESGAQHHNIQKSSSSSSSSSQTPTKGGLPKRVHTKLYLSTSSPGHGPSDHQDFPAPKTSQKAAPQKAASQQSTIQTKKAPLTNESGHLSSNKTPVQQCPAQDCADPRSPPQVASHQRSPHNSAEAAAKTRIPVGLKAFVKSPIALKKSSTIPGKQEKDHINTVSKETASSEGLSQSQQTEQQQHAPPPPPPYHLHLPPVRGTADPKALPLPPPQRNSIEESTQTTPPGEGGGMLGDKAGDRDSRLFKRSISITTKPHLKPALGMNGAKARSQSFSTNYMEKPTINTAAVAAANADGPGKVRTQIITNTAEKRNSLSRQSSFVEVMQQLKGSAGLTESGSSPSVSRPTQIEGITGSSSHHGLPDKATRIGSKGDVAVPSPQKEARSLPLSDRQGLKNSRRPAKVSSHPQFESTSFASSPDVLPQGKGSTTMGKQEVLPQNQSTANQSKPDEGEKATNPLVCSIEEKVMMGIEENVQKIQGLERSNSSEAKQKTGSSLANWFGFRKSKLPALNGKKTDSPKGKEEKKELKIGSVLGGRQTKGDKKKDKKKNDAQSKESQEFVIADNSNKMNSIMDHCNIQMGHITNQLQSSTTYIGKDQLVKELLGRTVAKGDPHAASVAAISLARRSGEMKGEVEIRSDTTILVTQKLTLHGEREDDHVPEPVCQDHMIGSSCQMRTLDSGIGTFPLPDPVNRQGGRNPPKPEPSAAAAIAPEMEEAPSATTTSPDSPDSPVCYPTIPCSATKVPSSLPEPCQQGANSMAHSPPDPSLPADPAREAAGLLRHPSTSDIIRPKRLSQIEYTSQRTAIPVSSGKPAEKRRNAKDQTLAHDRALRVCTYPGSSSDSEGELQPACVNEANTLRSPQNTQLNKTNSISQAGRVEELKRRSFGGVRSVTEYRSRSGSGGLVAGRPALRRGDGYARPRSQYLLPTETAAPDQARDNHIKWKIPERASATVGPPQGFSRIPLESLSCLGGSTSAVSDRLHRSVCGSSGGSGGVGMGTRTDSSQHTVPHHIAPRSDSIIYEGFASSCASQGSSVA
ncbi:nck-associated protein 5-like isoform X1 [Alosa sapidissima]|uniref:nck-associated protein 5-like isoform X1 n=2 Tax=Alosa sapidissima TaxID=34773 RepID=UPI001C09BD53|nr:nck-associated protein 5-like isoform X1 [Alosa sapidissima]